MIIMTVSGGYILASIIQCLNLFGKLSFPLPLLRLFSLLILLGHGWVLYQTIEMSQGQNLDATLMLSMTLWLMGLIIFLTFNDALIKLNAMIYLLNGIWLPISSTLHGVKLIHTANAMMLFHILISFVATSVLFLAVTHAGLLALQNKKLKQNANHAILKVLPPLCHMEGLLFVIIGVGVGLLTLSLISGLFYLDLFKHPASGAKFMLASLAWCMFLGILLGRYKFGLRGQSAIHLTLISGFLLFLSYFGTQFLLA
jgi:ABC-type uncharacterized transport system permease subunit